SAPDRASEAGDGALQNALRFETAHVVLLLWRTWRCASGGGERRRARRPRTRPRFAGPEEEPGGRDRKRPRGGRGPGDGRLRSGLQAAKRPAPDPQPTREPNGLHLS